MTVTPPLTHSLWWLLALGALFGTPGCKRRPAQKPTQPLRVPAAPPAAGVATAAAQRAVDALAVDVVVPLAPRFAGLVLWHFARPQMPAETVDVAADANTQVSITPAAPGTLRWLGPRLLAFAPTAPLQDDVAYDIALSRLVTPAGTRTPVSDNAWRTTFVSPALALTAVELAGFDTAQGTATLALLFTRPVRLDTLMPRVRVRVDGVVAGTPRVSLHDAATAYVALSGLHLRAGTSLTIELAEGVGAALGPAVLPATSVTHVFSAPPALHLGAPVLTGAGYVRAITIPCTDDATGGVCELAPDRLLAHLQITPWVPLNVAPTPNGFLVSGAWPPGTYALTVDGGLASLAGGTLAAPASTQVVVPAAPPSIDFVGRGRYAAREVMQSVPVRHINATHAELTVRQVHPQNLLFWLTNPTEATDGRTSDVLLQRRIALANEPDVPMVSWLNIADLLPGHPTGALELTLSTAAAVAVLRVIPTDLGVVALRGSDTSVRLWVLKSDGLTPVSGARVDLVTVSNRLVASCNSDAQGMCFFERAVDATFGRPAFAAMVRAGNDSTVVKLDDSPLQTSLADPQRDGAAAPATPAAYSVVAWADRAVARRGDMVHLQILARDAAGHAPAPAVPVVAQLYDAQHHPLWRMHSRTSAAGHALLEVPLPSDLARPSGDDVGRLEGTTTFVQLEAQAGGVAAPPTLVRIVPSVPDGLTLEARFTTLDLLPTDNACVSVTATTPSGVVPAIPVALTCHHEAAAFVPAKRGDFAFGAWQAAAVPLSPVDQTTATLDASGRAIVCCPTSSTPHGSDSTRLVADVHSTDALRPASAQALAWRHPDAHAIGLKSGVASRRVGGTVPIEGVLTDWHGVLMTAPRTVTLTLARLQESWHVAADAPATRRRIAAREVAWQVPVRAGRFAATLRPRHPGAAYVVRATLGGAASELLFDAAAGALPYDAPVAASTPAPAPPEELSLTTPESLALGETVKVSLTPPFAGRLLFLVDGIGGMDGAGAVPEARWLDVAAQKTDIAFSVSRLTPRVLVRAVVFAADGLTSGRRAVARQEIPMRAPAHTLDVRLTAPATLRADALLDFTVVVDPVDGPTYVSAVAQEEGCAGFDDATDILKVLQPRPTTPQHIVETFGWDLETVPVGAAARLGPAALPPLPAAVLTLASAGGSPPAWSPTCRGSGQVTWAGMVEVPRSGRVAMRLRLPHLRRDLRLAAAAFAKARVGYAATPVRLDAATPITAAWPPFARPDDVFEVPVTLRNDSAETHHLVVGMKGGRAVADHSGVAQPVTLGAGGRQRVVFAAQTEDRPGAAAFDVMAMGGATSLHASATVAPLPRSPVSTALRVQRVEPGETSLLLPDALVRAQLWLTTQPDAAALARGADLWRGPGNQLETRVSQLRVLTHLGGWATTLLPLWGLDGAFPEVVRTHLAAVLGLQTPEGAFCLYPREAADLWGSAYATLALLETRDAGFEVPVSAIDAALASLSAALGSDVAVPGAPLAAYVLARAGQPPRAMLTPTQRQLAPGPTQQEGLFLLEAAAYLAGMHPEAPDLGAAARAAPGDEQVLTPTFWSPLRAAALRVGVAQALFPKLAALAPRAAALAQALAAMQAPSRSAVAWTLVALLRRLPPPVWVPLAKEAVQISADGSVLTPLATPGGDGLRVDLGAVKAVRLQHLGMTPLTAILVAQTAALPGPVTGPLQLRRVYLNDVGAACDTVHVGEAVSVLLTLENVSDVPLAHVVVTEPVAAGFAIEALLPGDAMAANGWAWRDVDVAADHVTFYGDVPAHQSVRVAVRLRAVHAGRFSAPPATAAALYDENAVAHTAPQAMTVRDETLGTLHVK